MIDDIANWLVRASPANAESLRIQPTALAVRCYFVLTLLFLLSSCAVGPKYKRPTVSVPDTYRGPGSDAGQPATGSLGDEKWWTVFQDEQLQQLIRHALSQNYDVHIAAARVLEAQAALGITRADQLPTITGNASGSSQRYAKTAITPTFETSPAEANLALFWELDFWGKFRKATAAARATLLATTWAQHAVITSLISDVATAYFQLLELDMELAISQRTLDARKESVRLVEIRQKGGTTSLLELRQSQELMYTAAAAIPDLERRIEQQENFINILLGQNPGPILRGQPLIATTILPNVPAGLPSSLLERRPDVQSAEQQLVAANARIGIAKAAYFPQITLTAVGGYQSPALTDLFTGPAGFWSFVGQLTQPIFEGGRIRSGVKLTEAQQQEAVFFYKKTIQAGFREVSDSLIAYRKNQDFREQQASLTSAALDATRLANVRYQGGVTSYLEVLDTDTLSFTAELNLAQAELNERLALVQLYNALGGGWQQ
jgi:multidrug efflux system outer membrane protein